MASKEIEAILNRLHSGCRFISYYNAKVDGNEREEQTHNALRNKSHPDEVHADLGKALSSSYIKCLNENWTEIVSSTGGGSAKEAVDAGVDILNALVSGEHNIDDNKKNAAADDTNRLNYASVASAYFDQLINFITSSETEGVEADAVKSFVIGQWKQWCVACDELSYTSSCRGGGYHVRNACLKGYASICYNSESDCKTATLYTSLKHSTSRKLWIRLCVSNSITLIQSVASIPNERLVECNSSEGMEVISPRGREVDTLFVQILSPLFHVCVLQAKGSDDATNINSERQLILREVIRASFILLRDVKEDGILYQAAHMVRYLSTSLKSYLSQLATGYFLGTAADIMELAFDWLRGICDVMLLIMSKCDWGESLLCDSCEIILRYLPQITSLSKHVAFEMGSVYSALLRIVSGMSTRSLQKMADAKMALNLGTLVLGLHDDQEIELMCSILFTVFGALENNEGSTRKILVTSDTTKKGHPLIPAHSVKVGVDPNAALPSAAKLLWIGGLLSSLANVLCPRSVGAAELKKLGDAIMLSARSMPQEEKTDECNLGYNLIDILSQSFHSEFQFLIEIMNSTLADVEDESALPRRPLSLSEQYSAMLIGLAFALIALLSDDAEKGLNDPFSLLRSLLTIHPRISSRVVPSIIDVTRNCVSNGSPKMSLKAIEFLASSAIVSDPHGASIAWTCLSSLVADGIPSTIRTSVLRIMPGMCANNRKLRSRIRAVIGKSLASKDPVIRTAAMASLSDMAEQDLLRDIEEIVGWIQVGLKDEEAAVSYFALLALKYLVANDELDFDLVIRVLEKRLDIDLGDTSNILDVLGDGLVLEGFVMLLAEAGFEEEDEENEEELGPSVSSQSIKAVDLLVNLALSPGLSNSRVQMSILKSLAGLNSQILGLDAETIRSWNVTDADDEATASKKRYEDIKHIVLTSLELFTDTSSLDSKLDGMASEATESITKIMVTLLQFEEEAHGSSLFRGSVSNTSEKAKDKEKGENRTRVSKTALASLPDFETILNMYEDEPSVSTATAVMSSIADGNLSTEAMISQLSDLFADFASERFIEPHMQAIQISALMDAMNTLKRSIDQEPEQEELFRMITSEIQSWVASAGEYGYVALALFAVGVGTDLQPQLTDEATSIQNSFLQDFDTLMFDSEAVKLLCLCLVASKLSHSADSRVADIIDRLEMYFGTVVDSQVPFGVLFGMSVLLSKLVEDGNLSRTDPSDTWRRTQARRIISLYLSSLNDCLTLTSPTISLLEECARSETVPAELKDMCSAFDEPFVKDRSVQTLKSLMIGFGKSFQAIAMLDSDLSACILSIVEKLPWKSGKAFALPAAYKSCIETGGRDQNDLSNMINAVSSRLMHSVDDPQLGQMIFSIANLGQLRSRAEFIEAETNAVKDVIQAIMEPGREISGDRKQLAILSALALVGEVRGLFSLSSGLRSHTKKDLVSSTAEFLKVVASNESEDFKTREVATVSLGLLSGMRALDKTVQKSVGRDKNERSINFNEILQGKEDTLLLSILIRINASHSIITTAAFGDPSRTSSTRKLSVLFKVIGALALPGNVSRVIEVALNDCNKDELELKTACVELLASQLETRRRVGFDGRGFVDLCTRLLKMSPEDLRRLVGSKNVPILMGTAADLIPQLPTSSGEDALSNLWATCQYDLACSFQTQSAIQFFDGLKSILVSASSLAKKNVVSPAILRCIQRLVTSTFFEDMCKYAGPTPQKNHESSAAVEKLWIAYVGCISEVSDSTAISDYEVNRDNIFGIAACAVTLKQPSRVFRKVEMYLLKCELPDTGVELENLSLRTVLTALVAFGHQCSSISEMKVSLLSIFDFMLVKGLDTISLEVLAVTVAFWWDSLQMNQLDLLDSPLLQVSTRSSFLLTRNLCFKMQAWSLEMIFNFVDMCIIDLPPKLALLCQLSKVTSDVANKASRVLSAVAAQPDNNPEDLRETRALDCLKNLVQLLNGGES